jgi:REP element-mobilizing transposase RayT
MRRARLTFKGAYHHVMNRGHGGEKIFYDNASKNHFLNLLEEKSINQKIRIFAYCIMNNHYHLILQNSSGKLSEFMKQLNGDYGAYYRNKAGGEGYVFQGRFKSTLIQEDIYMKMAVVYVLLNPIRAGIVKSAWQYRWSSIRDYFTDRTTSFIDNEFINELFGRKKILRDLMKEWAERKLPLKTTRAGDVLGDERFIENAIRRFDRRKHKSRSKKMRKEEYDFPSVERMIKEFENEKELQIERLDLKTKSGRTIRNELLVLLKDHAGLPYSEIIRYPPFKSLKYSSLGQFYKRAKAGKPGA